MRPALRRSPPCSPGWAASTFILVNGTIGGAAMNLRLRRLRRADGARRGPDLAPRPRPRGCRALQPGLGDPPVRAGDRLLALPDGLRLLDPLHRRRRPYEPIIAAGSTAPWTALSTCPYLAMARGLHPRPRLSAAQSAAFVSKSASRAALPRVRGVPSLPWRPSQFASALLAAAESRLRLSRSSNIYLSRNPRFSLTFAPSSAICPPSRRSARAALLI